VLFEKRMLETGLSRGAFGIGGIETPDVKTQDDGGLRSTDRRWIEMKEKKRDAVAVCVLG
jgi:hypothetical protein